MTGLKIVQQGLPGTMACCFGVCSQVKDEEEPNVEQLVLPRPCRGTVLKLAHDIPEPSVEQLALPRPCRGTVLKLAHDIPASGHLGRRQTLRRIQQRLFWPGMTRDVAEYCRCCKVSQKSGGKTRGQQSPIVPIPLVEEPFQRVARDIVGPLDPTKSGNKYILVICHYGTR